MTHVGSLTGDSKERIGAVPVEGKDRERKNIPKSVREMTNQ